MNKNLPIPNDSKCCTIDHRVTYGEVDRMSYVYYGNYAEWFEMGRTELLRDKDYSYLNMEKDGFFLPVRKLDTRFYLPAKYDDLVKIVTTVTCIKKASTTFVSTVYKDSILLTKGTVELACTDKSGIPKPIPERISNQLNKFLWK